MKIELEHELFWDETIATLAEGLISKIAEDSPSTAHSIAALELTLLVVQHPPFTIRIWRQAAA